MTLRERFVSSVGLSLLYTPYDVLFFVYEGFSGIIHSIIVGSATAALTLSKLPTSLKAIGFPALLLVYCLEPFVAQAMWLRVQDRINNGYTPGIMSFFADLHLFASQLAVRAVLFLIVTLIIAALASRLRDPVVGTS